MYDWECAGLWAGRGVASVRGLRVHGEGSMAADLRQDATHMIHHNGWNNNRLQGVHVGRTSNGPKISLWDIPIYQWSQSEAVCTNITMG